MSTLSGKFPDIRVPTPEIATGLPDIAPRRLWAISGES